MAITTDNYDYNQSITKKLTELLNILTKHAVYYVSVCSLLYIAIKLMFAAFRILINIVSTL
jgi:hypothetical protein